MGEHGNSILFLLCFISIFCQKPSNGWIENVTGKSLPKTNIVVSKVCTRIQRCTTTVKDNTKTAALSSFLFLFT